MVENSHAETIFAHAIEIGSADERQIFLNKACSADPALRHEVERLVQDYFRAGKFLEHPVVQIASPTMIEPLSEQPGDTIGPYKLREQIGEGGFGVVYVAEQEQPVARKVALKIIKPGMDTKEVIARFEAERQALALMDHPHIAKVLDAGTTGEVEGPLSRVQGKENLDSPLDPRPSTLNPRIGRPYFVMELVHGLPITQFCDEHKLTNRDRLELFVDVCRAVQHAHQKGIIHRDLKPSNILVALDGDRPVPKVIDFGVSKALSQKLTDKTVYTAYGQMVGTPLYMAPEQAALSLHDVDTRSDVYSLGVLLYELLTGTTPFDAEALKQAGFDEMRRIIREDEPPRPSHRVSTLNAQLLSTACDRRKTDRRALDQSLRGELDWIVIKALEKDRNRRYESASAFAADVQRYLHDEPVQACPPSLAYRFRKFARRNRSVLATMAAVVLALIAGTAVSTWQAVEATRQRDRASEAEELASRRLGDVERERDRAEQNLEQALAAVDSMLTQVADEKLASVPFLEEVRRTLYEDALQVYRRLAEQDEHDPRVSLEMAKARRRVGWILEELGRHEESQEEYEAAAALLGPLLKQSPANAEAEIELARVRRAQGDVKTASLESRIASLSEAAAILERHAHAPDANAETRLAWGDCLYRLADRQGKAGDRGRAQQTFEEADRILSELYRGDPADIHVTESYSRCLQNYGIFLENAGKVDSAADRYRQALDVTRRLIAARPNDADARLVYAAAHINYAAALIRQNKYAEADAAYTETLAVLRDLIRDFPAYPKYRQHLAGTLSSAGYTAMLVGDRERGLQELREGVNILEYLTDNWPAVPSYHGELGAALSNLAAQLSDLAAKTGPNGADLEQAEVLAQRAIDEQRLALESPDDVNSFLAIHHDVLATIQMQLGRADEARATCEAGMQVVARLKQKNPDDPAISGVVRELQEILAEARRRAADTMP